jgi:hypothetical protein
MSSSQESPRSVADLVRRFADVFAEWWLGLQDSAMVVVDDADDELRP